MVPLDQLREQRFDRRHVTARFRPQQHTQRAGHGHSQRACDAASVAFVEQQQAGCAFDGQRDGLGFSWVEGGFELGHERPLAWARSSANSSEP